MLKPASRPITVLDYRELPEGPPFYQLIEGDLYMAPSPDAFHQDISGNIYFLIRSHLAKKPLGLVRFAPSDVELTDLNVYQPDIYFVAKARRSILTDHGVAGAPNLIVEVLSPRTARLDRGAKRAIYARTGVEELWLVDPEALEVTVYHLRKSADVPASIYKEKHKFQTPLLPGLRISVAKIFAR